MVKVGQKLTKALKISYTLVDFYLVDILWLLKAFGGARVGNFDIKPTDIATIFQVDYKVKLREKDEKIIGWCSKLNLGHWEEVHSANPLTTSSDM